MDNIKVFALLHTQKTGSFYEIFSTMLKSQLSSLFHQKLMKVFRSYHLKLVVGIGFGKSFGQANFFLWVPFEFKNKQFILPLFNVINFLLLGGTPKPCFNIQLVIP